MRFDIHSHGLRYAPEYPPYGHSDHLPMAWLALGALGASDERRDAFAAAYLPRLAALEPNTAHRRRVAELIETLQRRGVDAVLHERLPDLVSGWHREAYHPLIRLAYGVRFHIVGEVAAGLAYLEAAGPSPRLAALAQRATVDPHLGALELLETARRHPVDLTGARSFGERAERALANPAMTHLARTVPDNAAALSRAALDAFAASHDFFALHLVTGTHAFNILRGYAGPRADAVMNLGVLAGYLAIGAPAVAPYRPPPAARPVTPAQLLAGCRDDEHDVKLAHAAWEHFERSGDPAYPLAAADYLASCQAA